MKVVIPLGVIVLVGFLVFIVLQHIRLMNEGKRLLKSFEREEKK